MADELQYKLLKLEVTPPSKTWENIALQLDAEFDAAEIKISKKLSQLEIDPPVAAWPSILSALEEKHEESPAVKQTPRVVIFPWRKIAIAALIIGVISTSGILLINSFDNTKTTNAVATTTGIIENKAQPDEIILSKPVEDNNLVAAVTDPVRPKYDRRKSRSRQPDKKRPRQADAMIVSYADLDDLEAIRPASNISVAAPLIRDENGNIIMDLNLITSSDKEYIIVTSPNGQQTRISKKFLNLLRYMNSGTLPNELNLDGAEWKTKFQEWRDRLILQAAFIPSASNYMDIFELKELIQDK